MKPFKTLEEQYQILKGRGIQFDNIDKAKSYLLNNNYYNVINCYGKFFIDNNDQYKKGTNFNEITHVHYFDKELKGVLFKYIIEAEKHLKSIIAYRFSETYKNNEYAYLIATSYNSNDILKVTSLISTITNIINRQLGEKNTNPIKHYKNQHNTIPFWIVANYMNFGQMLKFYKYLKTPVQNKIAKDFSDFLNDNLETKNIRLQPAQLISFLDNVVELRNIVAHNNRVLGYKCRNNTQYLKILHSQYNICSNQQRQDVYNVFIIMQSLLSKNQYAQLHNTILSRTKNLHRKLSTISCNDILISLGFPNNWFQSKKLVQQKEK